VALNYMKQIGPRIALLGGGGAIGVFSADLAHEWGLEVPVFSTETRKRLRCFFTTPGNSLGNPLDTGSPALPAETTAALAKEVLVREPVDVLIIVLLLRTLEIIIPAFHAMNGLTPPLSGSYFRELLEALVNLKKDTEKEIVIVFDNRAHLAAEARVEAISREARDLFQQAGIPVYPSTERALRGIHHALVSRRAQKL